MIAILSAPAKRVAEQHVESMLREGIASWDGGIPAGASRLAKLTEPSAADAVIEDRR